MEQRVSLGVDGGHDTQRRLTDQLSVEVRHAFDRLRHRQAVAGQILVGVIRAIFIEQRDDPAHLAPPALEGGTFGQGDHSACIPAIASATRGLHTSASTRA
jgi:hypothetical protein